MYGFTTSIDQCEQVLCLQEQRDWGDTHHLLSPNFMLMPFCERVIRGPDCVYSFIPYYVFAYIILLE